jgi:hypothetical protein
MKRGEVFVNIIDPILKDILNPIGFNLDIKRGYFAKRDWGYDEIKIRIMNYGKSKSLSFLFCRRINHIEEIIERFFSIFHSNTPLGETLRVEENRLDLLSSGDTGIANVKHYVIIDSDGSIYNPDVDHLKSLIPGRIIPFMNQLETLDQLHHFINCPADRFGVYTNFFPFDGMTPYRKMIIAKLVNKDYKEVCDFVFNYFLKIYQDTNDTEKKELYEKYIKIYHEIKEII